MDGQLAGHFAIKRPRGRFRLHNEHPILRPGVWEKERPYLSTPFNSEPTAEDGEGSFVSLR